MEDINMSDDDQNQFNFASETEESQWTTTDGEYASLEDVDTEHLTADEDDQVQDSTNTVRYGRCYKVLKIIYKVM
jgi:hypothetical protein